MRPALNVSFAQRMAPQHYGNCGDIVTPRNFLQMLKENRLPTEGVPQAE